MELKYTNSARVFDVLVAFLLGVIPAITTWGLCGLITQGLPPLICIMAGWTLLCLAPFATLKWRSTVSFDKMSIRFRRFPGGEVTEISWPEVRGISLRGHRGIVVMGKGHRISVTDAYLDTGDVRQPTIAYATPAIVKRLEEDAQISGVLSFRIPTGWMLANLSYVALLLALSALTLLVVWVVYQLAVRCDTRSIAALIPILLFVALIVMVWRGARWIGGRVDLTQEEIVVRTMNRVKRIPLSDIQDVTEEKGGALTLQGKSLKRVSLSAELVNGPFLLGSIRSSLGGSRKAALPES